MKQLFRQTGPLMPAISCTVEAGSFGQVKPGTKFRCSSLEVDIITESPNGQHIPAFGVALRGAPQIPRGGWSMGKRSYKDPAPAALPDNYPVPLVRPNSSHSLWFIADIADLLQLDLPTQYYSLLHSTGTQKILFESPQIPISSSAASSPGLQFPQPQGLPKPEGAPLNPGSPNLGDLAAILNATGLFPDLSSAISMIESGKMTQINTINQGFSYSRSYTFDSGAQDTIISNSVFSILLLYKFTDYSQNNNPEYRTKLTYTVDSSLSPNWMLDIERFTFQFSLPPSTPLVTLSGGFYADEHTSPGFTNLEVHLCGPLSVVNDVFGALQMLAKFLPGGGSALLDVGLSDGLLSVLDTFNIADLPFGLGNLTDISVDLGLDVQLSPITANFNVGIGTPDNPFNWIASPLAGNGLMSFGLQNNTPALTIQAGIGLGLAIDLGIASGSASVTVAFQLNVTTSSMKVMVILTGKADVDVLDGLASASLTLSAGLGLGVSPLPVPPSFNPLGLPSITVTMMGDVSVGIHITVCWLISVSWDGSWGFSESVSTPAFSV